MFTHEAVELYERARFLGWLHRLEARLRGRPARLLDLAALLANRRLGASHELGLRSVPIAQIRGSEGRRDLFDDAFYPLDSRSRQRWLGIATAWLHGIALPPVELIRLGESYVVRDGHHRISVLRALGIREVEAAVSAWELTPTHPAGKLVAGPTAHPALPYGRDGPGAIRQAEGRPSSASC